MSSKNKKYICVSVMSCHLLKINVSTSLFELREKEQRVLKKATVSNKLAILN